MDTGPVPDDSRWYQTGRTRRRARTTILKSCSGSDQIQPVFSQCKAMPLDGHPRLDENISAATLSHKLWIKAADGGKAAEFTARVVRLQRVPSM